MSEVMQVTLTWKQVELAGWTGMHRQIRAVVEDRKGIAEQPNDAPFFQNHLEGAMGEVAVATALRLPWSGIQDQVGEDRTPDVGDLLQVRTTGKVDKFSGEPAWPVRRKDPDHHFMVMVFGRCPTYYLQGWIPIGEAKKIGEWSSKGNGRPPAWWIVRQQLKPMKQLPAVLAAALVLDDDEPLIVLQPGARTH